MSRVAVMRSRQIVEIDSTQQTLTAPMHSYTRTLLAAVPSLRTDRARPLAMAADSLAEQDILSAT